MESILFNHESQEFKVNSISKEFSRLIQTRHFNGCQRAMEFARVLLERPLEVEQLKIKMPPVMTRGRKRQESKAYCRSLLPSRFLAAPPRAPVLRSHRKCCAI
jgi:hypothetical protein